jgi:type IV fimbrial biogenesis protein FimT
MTARSIRKHRGFSLIELFIGLALFAILLVMVGPIFNQRLGDAQIKNAAEAMLDGVRLTQSVALKNNLPAVFTLNPATGWTVTVDDPEKPGTPLFTRTYALADGAPLAAVQPPIPVGATQVTFDGLGRLLAKNADGSDPIQQLDIVHSKVSGTRPLRVLITGTASGVGTLLCDPQVAAPPLGCP